MNIWANPFGLYGSGGFKGEVTNYRKLKLQLLAEADPAPDTLILGSSTVMTIPPAEVEKHLGGTAFNFGMTSGQPNDFYAVVRTAVEDDGLPIRNIVLGLDQCAFNAAIPQAAEAWNLPEFRKYQVHGSGLQDLAHAPVPMLISMEQTHASYVLVRRYLRKNEPLSDRILPDGQAVKTAKDRQIEAGTFDLEGLIAKRVRKWPVRWLRINEFRGPDLQALKYLDNLLAYCQAHGIRVYAYLTPYHPRLWRVIDEFPNAGVLGEVNAAIAEKFRAYGIEFHDLSHIESFGGSPDLFYDEVHMQSPNQLRLIDRLFVEEGALR